ncbi:hypothetical protein TRIATDRAFT_298185 [Trichoderma atroviride IMI 206040]|uniref:Uncharacterized protein n=1 Tax=Hypocrea atroviridis (strain ATCC 20476 / IMI 206040) TaxID=452589 RepID=G9NM02_HYPAI|nr:uncharacterized protein TRIATDRAFT_298185 [Trichoderma atroviride IMI 206040]EHK47936.1 hypothetical protein TRIATDRAFT_298185 [Trichoderma atroviride IMI 206040]
MLPFSPLPLNRGIFLSLLISSFGVVAPMTCPICLAEDLLPDLPNPPSGVCPSSLNFPICIPKIIDSESCK